MKRCQEAKGSGVPPCSTSLVLSLSPLTALKPQGNTLYLEAQKGQFLRLLCAADSEPPATLSWARDNQVLSWSHPSGSRTLELVMPRVKPEDAGRYSCRAENGLGSQSRSLHLSVQCEWDRQVLGFWEGRRVRTQGLEVGSQSSKGTLNPSPMGLRIQIPIPTWVVFFPIPPSNSL